MPAAITSTALVTAVTTSEERILNVKSATGFVVGYGLYIDREYSVITSILGTIIGVRRGAWGTRATPHLAGSRVYVAPPNYFTTYDRFGAGTFANETAQPYINILTGSVWSVLGGKWRDGNIYGQTTNYGLSPAIWDDCPLEKMLVDPGYGSCVGDDFLDPMIVTTAHGYVWSGAASAVTHVAGVAHGAIIALATGTDKDECYLSSGNNIRGCILADATSTWWLETRIKINQITTAQGVFVGLAEEAGNSVACMVDDDNTLIVQDAIGFQIVEAANAAAHWDTIIQLTGGALATVQTPGSVATTAYTKLGMKSVAGLVTFYVDGVALTTQVLSSAANFPLNQNMQMSWFTKCGSGVANSITIDWWKAAQTRIAN